MRVLNRHHTGFDAIAPGEVGNVDEHNVAVKMWLNTGRFIPLDGSAGSTAAPTARDIESLVERLADRDGVIDQLNADNEKLSRRMADMNDQLDAASRAAARAADAASRTAEAREAEFAKAAAEAAARITALEADIDRLLAAPAAGDADDAGKPADGGTGTPAEGAGKPATRARRNG